MSDFLRWTSYDIVCLYSLVFCIVTGLSWAVMEAVGVSSRQGRLWKLRFLVLSLIFLFLPFLRVADGLSSLIQSFVRFYLG